ncbi:hypothetical protein R1flu_028747 [Riccia fluitans]|uniref:Uncharacterized protein n=1 Tax=Riccia fluitans TaxID=41844 RepID=A0ABD1XML1_9MARC
MFSVERMVRSGNSRESTPEGNDAERSSQTCEKNKRANEQQTVRRVFRVGSSPQSAGLVQCGAALRQTPNSALHLVSRDLASLHSLSTSTPSFLTTGGWSAGLHDGWKHSESQDPHSPTILWRAEESEFLIEWFAPFQLKKYEGSFLSMCRSPPCLMQDLSIPVSEENCPVNTVFNPSIALAVIV